MDRLLYEFYDLEKALTVLQKDFPQIETIYDLLLLGQFKKITLTANIIRRTLISPVDVENHVPILESSSCLALVDHFKNQYILSFGVFEIVDYMVGKYDSLESLVQPIRINYNNELYSIHDNFYHDLKIKDCLRIIIRKEHLEHFRQKNKLDDGLFIDNDKLEYQAPIPIKGKPETLVEWVKWKVENEGMNKDGKPIYGFQTRLIDEAFNSFNYGESSIKTAWKKAGFVNKG